MARLLLIAPEGQQVVDLRPHNSLGRHPSNTIQLLDKIVSKEHCLIVQRDGAYVLKDLGSLNGTYVNGERVAGERGLRGGDEIALGSTRARFDDGSGLPAGAGAPQSGWQSAPGTAASAIPQSHQQQPFSGIPATQGALSPIQPMQPAGPVAQTFGSPAAAVLPQQRPGSQTRVDVSDAGRSIGTQIAATNKGFQPYDQIASNPAQLSADYERLRLSNELSREICLERDLSSLLNKILISVFRFIRADRGVIFLKDEDGELQPGASLRRDGKETAITVSSTILDHVIKERATVLTHDAAMDFAGSKGKSMILNRISSAIVAPLLHDDDILGVMWLDSETLAQFQPKDMEMVTAIAAQAAMFIEINILGRKVEQEIVNRERFSRLLSPNVAEKVISGEMVVAKGGKSLDMCTVFNSDIRGFTSMSETMTPEQIVDMLNEYFELMVETIFKYDGTLDKFMGDGIMALWGAPVQADDDVVRCVESAVEQVVLLEDFNERRAKEKGARPLGIGVGIHTGPLVAGYIGSSKALSYTVIGDTANTSARLCSAAKPGQIVVSRTTLDQLGGKFPYEELPPANLKGKSEPFSMFAIKYDRTMVQIPAVASTE